MLSEKEFVDLAFAIAAEMAKEPVWAHHVRGVDAKFIRFKSGKNLNAERLGNMWPDILELEIDEVYEDAIHHPLQRVRYRAMSLAVDIPQWNISARNP